MALESIIMDKKLSQLKQEIALELSSILKTVPALKKRNNPAVLELVFEEALHKISRLYYLCMYQVEYGTKLNSEQKNSTQDKLRQEYQTNMARLGILFTQK